MPKAGHGVKWRLRSQSTSCLLVARRQFQILRVTQASASVVIFMIQALDRH
jgi:hypothetical protein